MNLSTRASEIYKLIKPSGGTWQQAMKQAYQEIIAPVREREEREAKAKLSSAVTRARNSIGGTGILRAGNDVIADIIEAVEDKYIDGGYPYPYTLAFAEINRADVKALITADEAISEAGFSDNDIELVESISTSDASGLSEIEDLVYTYSNRDEWDSKWRNVDGKISNDYKISIDNIIDKFDINSSELINYSKFAAYFTE